MQKKSYLSPQATQVKVETESLLQSATHGEVTTPGGGKGDNSPSVGGDSNGTDKDGNTDYESKPNLGFWDF